MTHKSKEQHSATFSKNTTIYFSVLVQVVTIYNLLLNLYCQLPYRMLVLFFIPKYFIVERMCFRIEGIGDLFLYSFSA